jgi:hypothetical protein
VKSSTRIRSRSDRSAGMATRPERTSGSRSVAAPDAASARRWR